MWVSIISSLASFLSTVAEMFRTNKLVQTGKDLEKGEEDAKILKNVKKANDARANIDNNAIDNELRID